MKPHELKLIAKLLELAADQFSNHCCNDYDLVEQGLTPEEAYQVNRAYAEWKGYDNWQNDYPEDELQTYAIGGDAGLMYYLADLAKKATEDISRRSAPEYPQATPEHLRTDTKTRWG